MPKFVGDGYKDREELAETLCEMGFSFASHRGEMEGVVAVVLGVLTDLLPKYEEASPQEQRRAQERDLFDTVTGIVACARDEGLIDDPVG